MIHRNLLDPNNLATGRLDKLNNKLSVARTIMALSPKNGGMPFVYSFAATKEHILDNISILGYDQDDGSEIHAETAATNGLVYKWHPDFLEKLTSWETLIVVAHETYHIIMQHCNPARCFGKFFRIWNIAIDFVVHASIEHDMRHNLRYCDNLDIRIDPHECDKAYASCFDEVPSIHPIWKGNFGRPKTLDGLLKDIAKHFTEPRPDPALRKKLKKKGKNEIALDGVYADYSLYGRSAESIYDEIINEIKKHDSSFGELSDLLDALSNGWEGLDFHEEIDISKSKLLEEILSAAVSAKKLVGSIPASIEEELKNLENPSLKWEDLVRHCLQNIRQNRGSQNDFTKFRRRQLSLGFYTPRKKDQSSNWLCLLDTSGSMSQDDIAYGISQLKVLDSRSRGIVVPCDAQAYWDKATYIHSISDIPKIKVVGRGGTVFSDFFLNYKKHIKEKIDLIIVITDGFVDLNFPKPPVDVVFVITNNTMPQLPWGRIAPLRAY